MPKAEANDHPKPGPKPKLLYRCINCWLELGAREARTHRRNCPGRTMFCANQDSAGKRGPKPKIHYLCLACAAGLSESGVRSHHRDCAGTLQPVSTTATTLAALKAQRISLKPRTAALEARLAELNRQ